MKQEHFIKQFNEISKTDTSSAGGKGASLGEMTRAGIPVPSGFVILAAAFERFLREAELHSQIDAILHKVDHRAMHTVEQTSEEIKALILAAKMPKDIAQEILTAYNKLNAQFVAVRSSATAEDSSVAAWAGQLESYLNTTKENLLENVKKCWASLFTPRAIFYRFEQNLHETHISVAVVVQKMVASEVSGIAFSVHPVTQDYNQLIIEAGYGLGEAIVSGQITPDSYVVEKKNWDIIEKNVSTQAKALYRSRRGGNAWKEMVGDKQKISDTQIIELAKLIVKIEQHYNFPVDVEWAFEKGKWYIVQSRSITTLTKKIMNNKSQEIKWYHLGKWIEPALAAEMWLTYGKYAQQFFIQKLDGKILYLNGDFFLSQHDMEIIKTESYEAAKNKKRAFFEKLNEKIISVSNTITTKSRKIKSPLRFIESYQELTGVWMPLNIVSIGVEQYVNETDPTAFTVACGKTAQKPWTLQQVDEMRKLKRGIRKVPQRIEELPEQLRQKVRTHVKKYEWKGSHHFGIHTFTVNELLKQMKEDDGKNQKIPETASGYLVELLDLMGFIRFRCAEASGISSYYLSRPLRELAQKNCLSYEDIVEHTIEEITSGKLQKSIAEHRRKNTGFLFDRTQYVLTDEEIRDYQRKLIVGEKSAVNEIKGMIACKGRAKGVVKIVRSKSEMKEFQKGMILVAYETTPDVIPAMKLAGAIVTDFGGLTSHAAIISREFNIPCIVGTQFATSLLKDGDVVEVDATNGRVRKIK